MLATALLGLRRAIARSSPGQTSAGSLCISSLTLVVRNRPHSASRPRGRLADQVEDAVHDCKTLAHAIAKEREITAMVDGWTDVAPNLKAEAKEMIARRFEALRMELGG